MSAFDPLLETLRAHYAQAETLLGPVALATILTTAGIVLFAVFSGTLYQRLARKEIFRPPTHTWEDGALGEGAGEVLLLVAKYTFGFPLITLVWTAALTLFLIALSRNQALETLIVLPAAMVAAMRICAYLDERIAEDLGKLLPVALLVVAITDPASFSPDAMAQKAALVAASAERIAPLFGALVALEWGLRILLQAKRMALGGGPDEMSDDDLGRLLAERLRRKRREG